MTEEQLRYIESLFHERDDIAAGFAIALIAEVRRLSLENARLEQVIRGYDKDGILRVDIQGRLKFSDTD